MEKSLVKDFSKYDSLNILGMIGVSFYILADTYYIAKALGATGIAALNFAIPVFSIILGIGLMIGIGGAARFGILKSRNKHKEAEAVFAGALKLGTLAGLLFAVLGLFGSKALSSILGADAVTLPLTHAYMATIMVFAPFFILNNTVLARPERQQSQTGYACDDWRQCFECHFGLHIPFPTKNGDVWCRFCDKLGPDHQSGHPLDPFRKKEIPARYFEAQVDASGNQGHSQSGIFHFHNGSVLGSRADDLQLVDFGARGKQRGCRLWDCRKYCLCGGRDFYRAGAGCTTAHQQILWPEGSQDGPAREPLCTVDGGFHRCLDLPRDLLQLGSADRPVQQ